MLMSVSYKCLFFFQKASLREGRVLTQIYLIKTNTNAKKNSWSL